MVGKSSLRSIVLETLKADILSRRIPGGHILLEKEVASRLSVSKTPVREALALLCQENLVWLFPRRGYVVREVGLQEVVETFDLRVILEGAAAERAAVHLTNSELDELALLSEDDCCSPVGEDQTEEVARSLEFHLLIARGSRNMMLAEQIEKLLRASQRITAIGFTRGEHAAVIEALRTRNPSLSRKAMEEHITSGRRLALETLGQQTSNEKNASSYEPQSPTTDKE